MKRDLKEPRGYAKYTLLLCLAWFCAGSVIADDDDGRSLDFNGDFRYRIEQINTEGDGLAPYTRHRIRARFGFHAILAPEARFAFQLASGDDNPLSTNQTLGDGFSSKSIVLDLAYGEFEPLALHRRVTIVAGRSIVPFYRPGHTELLWDSDLRPEGITSFMNIVPNRLDLKLLSGWYLLQDRDGDDNSILLAAQIVSTVDSLPYLSRLTIGVGIFHFSELKDRPPLYDDNFSGNSFYSDTTYGGDPPEPHEIEDRLLYGYEEIEVFFDAEISWLNQPLLLMGDLVFNTSPKQDRTAGLAGFKWGIVDERGSWSLWYNYRYVEKDAVYGAFSDSNFRGGGTDGKGHEAGFSLGLIKDVKVGITYFNDLTGTSGGDRYQRWILDVSSVFE
jgi:hypothetical protein